METLITMIIATITAWFVVAGVYIISQSGYRPKQLTK
jgi:hypothetical protein